MQPDNERTGSSEKQPGTLVEVYLEIRMDFADKPSFYMKLTKSEATILYEKLKTALNKNEQNYPGSRFTF